MTDCFGKEIKVGDKVLRACHFAKHLRFLKCYVSRIEEKKIYVEMGIVKGDKDFEMGVVSMHTILRYEWED